MFIFYLKGKVVNKQIHKGVKQKRGLNHKWPQIKSEDFSLFSSCYKIPLLRLDLLFRIVNKVPISLFKGY